MISLLRLLASLTFCIPFLAILSCGTIDRKETPPSFDGESQLSQTFLENHHQLKTTNAYRQNIWISLNQGQDPEQAALCVDLQNQVYLVIQASSTVRTQTNLPEYYQNLSVSVQTLRSRMDPDAFILENRNLPIVGLFRVPENPPESFPADVIGQLLGKNIPPGSLRYQAD